MPKVMPYVSLIDIIGKNGVRITFIFENKLKLISLLSIYSFLVHDPSIFKLANGSNYE
jgi:hypothetical protein